MAENVLVPTRRRLREAIGEAVAVTRNPTPTPFSVVVLVLFILPGCDSGDGLDRQPIQGTVTLDREPLADGAVLFEPATNESGTAVGATIHGGVFSIPRAAGPVPGAYRVRIYAASDVQAPPGPGQSPRASRPMVERVPKRYNAQTTLKAQVGKRQANHFRFALESDKGETAP